MRASDFSESARLDEGSMSEQVKVIVRDFRPKEDEAMIYSTWRNSAFYGASATAEQKRFQEDPKIFFRRLTATIRDTLRGALVLIACVEDAPEVILGYSVSTGSHLDWIYVKLEFRGKGIGAALMPKSIETVTANLTKIGATIVEKKKLKIKENDNGRNENRIQEIGKAEEAGISEADRSAHSKNDSGTN